MANYSESDRQALFDVSRLWTKRTLKILGAFAELRIATISYFMSVCPSAWNNSVPIEGIFMKFSI